MEHLRKGGNTVPRTYKVRWVARSEMVRGTIKKEMRKGWVCVEGGEGWGGGRYREHFVKQLLVYAK
jgi:hypothetical protein